MASAVGVTSVSESRALIDDMRTNCPEAALLVKMINRDDFSAAQAVDQILPLTKAAADEAFRTRDQHGPYHADALWLHADTVGANIVALARRVPHGQQSKLVDFVLHLQKTTVPDSNRGGNLQLDGAIFWADMPEMSLKLSEYQSMVHENKQHFENCHAFVAQLSEIAFQRYSEVIGWNVYPMTRVLEDDYVLSREHVRLLCIWLIYAPNKVWSDAQQRRSRKTGTTVREFKPEFWSQWKELLQNCQKTPSPETSDQDTQALLRRALGSISKIEAIENK
ncbi:unnamed protein product [Clonostachys rosea]|uniref:Uncharacterized protein n=1 Tax=Bionectria ochroleuca TaxID=29856 RepID=A0ABY6TU54_BIOOC|nr:unnamed protein product [Clonostachys rosea]